MGRKRWGARRSLVRRLATIFDAAMDDFGTGGSRPLGAVLRVLRRQQQPRHDGRVLDQRKLSLALNATATRERRLQAASPVVVAAAMRFCWATKAFASAVSNMAWVSTSSSSTGVSDLVHVS